MSTFFSKAEWHVSKILEKSSLFGKKVLIEIMKTRGRKGIGNGWKELCNISDKNAHLKEAV